MQLYITLSLVALTALVSVGPLSAGATLTIDNFEEGAFSLQTDGPLVEDIQVGLSITNVLSGQRRVQLGDVDDPPAPPPSSVSLSLTSGDDAAEFFYPLSEGMTVNFIYEFDTPVDLTASGLLDRFVVTYTEATPSAPADTTHGIRLTSGVDELGLGGGYILGAGEYTFLLPTVGGIDFTQIDKIELEITTGSIAPFTAAISHFAVIPEPSTATLLAVGLAGIAAGRRRAAARFH
jgi:hypothetical protein